MAMNSLNSFIFSTTALLITLLRLVFCSASSFNQKPPSDTNQGLLFGEKSRLGSTPPSCHNKCNQCHPCMAVEVPTLPSHDRVQPVQTTSASSLPMDYYDLPSSSSLGNNKYSNYKPLGWKCRCDDHFYNP